MSPKDKTPGGGLGRCLKERQHRQVPLASQKRSFARPWKRHVGRAVPVARMRPFGLCSAAGRAKADTRVDQERLEVALEAAGLGQFEWDLMRDVLVISPCLAELTG